MFNKIVKHLFQGVEPLKLGRWCRKDTKAQLSFHVPDPGYDQTKWSEFPSGKLRQEAIKKHYQNLDVKTKSK